MAVFCCCNFALRNILKLWINFKHAFQTVWIRGHSNCYFRCVFVGIWYFGVCCVHCLHQENNQLQACHRMCMRLSNDFWINKRIVDEFGNLAKSIDFIDDFGYGVQSYSHGPHQLWSWLLTIVSCWRGTGCGHCYRRSHALYCGVNLDNQFNSRIWNCE